MEIARGSVVLMVSPSELGKPRPGVVVQAGEIRLSTIFVCPVTSHLQNDLPIRPFLETSSQNGLRIRSQVMTDKMFSLRHDRIRQVIGRLDNETLEQVNHALLIVLGLAGR